MNKEELKQKYYNTISENISEDGTFSTKRNQQVAISNLDKIYNLIRDKALSNLYESGETGYPSYSIWGLPFELHLVRTKHFWFFNAVLNDEDIEELKSIIRKRKQYRDMLIKRKENDGITKN